MKIGDEVAYIERDRNYWYSAVHAWVISIGDDVVVLHREVAGSEYIQGMSPIVFVDKLNVYEDGSAWRKCDELNKR